MKERVIEGDIKKLLRNHKRALEVFLRVKNDKRWRALAEMSNVVAVGRWGYNDHGPVHCLIVTRNSIKIAQILKNRGIKFSYEEERNGSFEDSLIILILASMFHDVGNIVNRKDHEVFSFFLSKDIIFDILDDIFDEDKIIEIFSYVGDGILGHMGNYKPTSLEGQIVALADGLDMEMGRARIPYKIGRPDIHKFSALAIKRVEILEGEEKPIIINVYMDESAGVFQIEEVLLPKIEGTKLKEMIEINAIVKGEKIRYL